jgi:hypothetical protein
MAVRLRFWSYEGNPSFANAFCIVGEYFEVRRESPIEGRTVAYKGEQKTTVDWSELHETKIRPFNGLKAISTLNVKPATAAFLNEMKGELDPAW